MWPRSRPVSRSGAEHLAMRPGEPREVESEPAHAVIPDLHRGEVAVAVERERGQLLSRRGLPVNLDGLGLVSWQLLHASRVYVHSPPIQAGGSEPAARAASGVVSLTAVVCGRRATRNSASSMPQVRARPSA